jgi:alanyl-tRNA synthetase
VTPEELERVEALVNQQIEAQHPVYTQVVDQAKALRIKTLRAVFGEQYPDRVRVVSIGAPIGNEDNPEPDTLLSSPDDPKWMKYPVEFCGGTHLSNSAEAERFVLISEEGVAKGIRRVVGVSGEAARNAEATGQRLLAEADALLECAAGEARPTPSRDRVSPSRDRKGAETQPSRDRVSLSRDRKGAEPQPSRDREGADLAAELASLQRTINDAVIPVVVRHKLGDRLAELRRIAKKQAKQRSAESGRSAMDQVAALLESAETVNGVTIVVGQIDDAPAEALRGAIDWVRNKTPASAVLLASTSGAKVILVAGMSDEVVKRGLKAGDLVREVAPTVGGSGGGKPTLAQAGGKNPEAVPQALERAKELLRQRLV